MLLSELEGFMAVQNSFVLHSERDDVGGRLKGRKEKELYRMRHGACRPGTDADVGCESWEHDECLFRVMQVVKGLQNQFQR